MLRAALQVPVDLRRRAGTGEQAPTSAQPKLGTATASRSATPASASAIRASPPARLVLEHGPGGGVTEQLTPHLDSAQVVADRAAQHRLLGLSLPLSTQPQRDGDDRAALDRPQPDVHPNHVEAGPRPRPTAA